MARGRVKSAEDKQEDGLREEGEKDDVLMFCRCPTTERCIKNPGKRKANSERKRGVTRE